jgi:SAM-dependent methyltransferase
VEFGERQVAPDVTGIRRDHVARYEFAASNLPPGSRVIDLACGVGYGAKILADAGHQVLAVDRNEEAIAYARKHYAHEKIIHLVSTAETFANGEYYDAAVCFETIEHLNDPLQLLKYFRQTIKWLIASVPNQEKLRFVGQKFHKRHYTRSQFSELLASAGFKVTGWFGQNGTHSELEHDLNGRTVMVTAERDDSPTPEAKINKPEVPLHVCIVGLGPSAAQYFEQIKVLGGRNAYCDEVWGINAMGNVIACDRPGSSIAPLVEWLKTHSGPIYTSALREGYPGLVAFPLQDVMDNGGVPYFNSTVAYAIAFARHIGVKKISIFGCDFTYANSHHGERGRACVEFWLGLCTADGMEIELPGASSLMDACEPPEQRLYGYDGFDVIFNDAPDGKVALEFQPRELPTADEIEKRYDHSQHTNPLMKETKT